MKKAVFLLSGLAATSLSFGQLSIGAKAGLNYTIESVSIDPEPDEKPDNGSGIGFHVGGFLQYNFSDMLGIRPELLYSMRGFQADETTTTVFAIGNQVTTVKNTAENKSSYSYIEVPILLSIQPSEAFSIHVGPGFGLLMGGKVKSEGTMETTVVDGGDVTTSTSSFSVEASGSNVTDGLRKLEIAAVIGLGYQLESGLGFNLRYWRGLNSINEDTDLGGTEVKYNTNLFQFSVCYAFIKG
ncbi:MAG TPA: porin family protein [Flavobacteriales bacterium]|jgi:hypothetical protein|nr:porin family protein [Flavobacteriales bacterium]